MLWLLKIILALSAQAQKKTSDADPYELLYGSGLDLNILCSNPDPRKTILHSIFPQKIKVFLVSTKIYYEDFLNWVFITFSTIPVSRTVSD